MTCYARESRHQYNPWVEMTCWKRALGQGGHQYGPQGNRDNHTDQSAV